MVKSVTYPPHVKGDAKPLCKTARHFTAPFGAALDSRSNTWRKFLACATRAPLKGDIGFGMRVWFLDGDLDCNNCRDATRENLFREIENSVWFNGYCSLPECMRLTPPPAAFVYIDTLFKNPPVVRCESHKHTHPKCMPRGSHNANIYWEGKDLSFSVHYYQE